MTKFQNSILINRPLKEVFALLSNAENDPKWKSGAVEVKKTSKGSIGIDSTWSSIAHLLGRRIESETAYTEYEANWKYTAKSTSGPFPFESRVTFEHVAGLTSVSMRAEGDPGGFLNLREPLLTSMVKRQIQADLANLKDLMETRVL